MTKTEKREQQQAREIIAGSMLTADVEAERYRQQALNADDNESRHEAEVSQARAEGERRGLRWALTIMMPDADARKILIDTVVTERELLELARVEDNRRRAVAHS